MASEIRVNKIENRSGLGTVTFADTGVDLAGIVTATTFSGSGASLTALPAAQVTGTLPAISGANLTALNGSNIASGTVADARISTLTASKLSGALPAISAANLTNVPAANVVGVHTSLTVTNATTTGTAVVGGGVTISESGIEASGIGITCANINGGAISGRRNKIINGAMMVSQRNLASAVQLSASEQYIVDRFKNDTGSSFDMKADASQSTDAPDGFSNSLKLACDGVSTPSSTQNGTISTWLEGQDVQDLAFGTSNAKPLTLSFYAKSASQNNGHVYGVFLGAYLNGTRNAQTRGFTITSSWQRFIMTFDGTGTVTSTAINNDNNQGLQLSFSLAAGSSDLQDYSTWTANAGLLGFTGQDNFFDNTSNEIYITGVQLEVGSQATAFEHRSFNEELALCQRYYEKSYNYTHAPGTNTNHGSVMFLSNRNSGTPHTMLRYATRKRAAPTLVSYATGAADTTGMKNLDANETYSNYTMNRNGEMGCTVYPDATPVIGQFIQFNYTADADF